MSLEWLAILEDICCAASRLDSLLLSLGELLDVPVHGVDNDSDLGRRHGGGFSSRRGCWGRIDRWRRLFILCRLVLFRRGTVFKVLPLFLAAKAPETHGDTELARGVRGVGGGGGQARGPRKSDD